MTIRNSSLRTAVVHELVTLNREQRYRGARLVASVAHDAADCKELLDTLGLDPADGRSPADGDPADHLRDVDRHEPRSLVERMAVGRTELEAT
jgi:hypothetical protein